MGFWDLIMAKKCPRCGGNMKNEWNRTTTLNGRVQPFLWGWWCKRCNLFLNKQTGGISMGDF